MSHHYKLRYIRGNWQIFCRWDVCIKVQSMSVEVLENLWSFQFNFSYTWIHGAERLDEMMATGCCCVVQLPYKPANGTWQGRGAPLLCVWCRSSGYPQSHRGHSTLRSQTHSRHPLWQKGGHTTCNMHDHMQHKKSTPFVDSLNSVSGPIVWTTHNDFKKKKIEDHSDVSQVRLFSTK